MIKTRGIGKAKEGNLILYTGDKELKVGRVKSIDNRAYAGVGYIYFVVVWESGKEEKIIANSVVNFVILISAKKLEDLTHQAKELSKKNQAC